MEKRTIKTNLYTYNQYVKQGLWKPKGEPKFHQASNAIVEADCKLKRKRGDEEDIFIAANIIIENFYSKDQVAPHR